MRISAIFPLLVNLKPICLYARNPTCDISTHFLLNISCIVICFFFRSPHFLFLRFFCLNAYHKSKESSIAFLYKVPDKIFCCCCCCSSQYSIGDTIQNYNRMHSILTLWLFILLLYLPIKIYSYETRGEQQ